MQLTIRHIIYLILIILVGSLIGLSFTTNLFGEIQQMLSQALSFVG